MKKLILLQGSVCMQYLCLLVQQKLHVLHAHNTMSIVSNVHCSRTETSKNDVNILIWSCYVVLLSAESIS